MIASITDGKSLFVYLGIENLRHGTGKAFTATWQDIDIHLNL